MGLGALATFLSSIFSGLLSFFASYLGKKVALGAALTATMLGITLAFYAALKALVSGLVTTISNEFVLMGFYAIWPSNAEACIAACFSAEVAAFLYRMHLDTVRSVSQAQ